tara:strand:- start:84885 stop:85001 length:117 start_codon:yes stop_codon:yes gene_type:complete
MTRRENERIMNEAIKKAGNLPAFLLLNVPNISTFAAII